ncbi:hypothetical protein CYMTET_36548, partial [Cymbomonas tetramitiformis]
LRGINLDIAKPGEWEFKARAEGITGTHDALLKIREIAKEVEADLEAETASSKPTPPSSRAIIPTDDASLKTCFWWAREGAAPEQYVYKRMPFGSTNSTAMFGGVIEHELRGLSCAKVYCDDILVTSPTAQQHIADLEATMERLSKVGLRGYLGKSVIAAGGCEFLGFPLRPGKL